MGRPFLLSSMVVQLVIDDRARGRFDFRRHLIALCVALAGTQVLLPGHAQTTANFESLQQNAAAARERGDLPQAIQLYSQAVALNPNWPDGWWYLGMLQYQSDLYLPARDALSHYIGLTDKAGAALALRGLCEFEIGSYPEALGDIQHGIAQGAANQPRNAEILYYHEALLLTRLGRFEESLAKFAVFVPRATPNPELNTALGLAGLRIAALPREADPAQMDLIANVGAATAALFNRDASADAEFQQVFDRFPAAPNIHYLYGYLIFPADPDRAAEEFRKELAIVPASARAHAMLAWVQELQGDFAAALPNAQKAAAEDATLSMVQLVLGRALVETGDTARGLPYIENVLRAEPENLEAHLTVAKAYSRLGRKDDARRERLLCLQISDRGTASSATP
jgi:tetratricopeptide (TPR) repeat protein